VILPLAAAATVLVIVATYAVVALMRSHNASQPADDVVAPQTIGRLWNLANELARANGATIENAEAVLTTAADVSRVLFDSAGSHETTQPTWAVQAETTEAFACSRCGPPGLQTGAAPAPQRKWHFIVLAVRAANFEQVAGGYTVTGKDMTQLGKVITLHDTGVPTPTPTLAPALVPSSGAPSTSVTLPGSITFTATPVGRGDLSSAAALSTAQRANPELKVPVDAVAIHGVLTDPGNRATPVWAFRYHSCEAPHAPIKTINPLCTRWVFLQSQDGSFVEATYTA
jgi:hypothetical protein